MKLSALCFGAFASAQLTDSGCDRINGQCLDWRYYKCTAGYETGLCSGDSNRKCCKPCDTTCQWQESQDAKGDAKCNDAGGKCQHNTNYCSGSYQGGMCGGSSSRQCCGASGGGGGGDCNLVRYSNTHIKGYNGLRIEVDAGFKSEMDKMNRFAIDCSVTVQVTHAFRKEGQNIGGTIVPPASNSNHLVGHAIDFNLETPNGWCNGDCLDWETNSYARCFTNKIKSDRTLRWGQSFNDPVHIDDYLNGSNPSAWDQLYYQNQSC